MSYRSLIALSAAAALLATAGDFLLLSVVDGSGADPGIVRTKLTIGAVFGVLTIPVYAIGYRALADLPGFGSARSIVRWCGVLIGLIGAFIHGLTAYAIYAAIESGVVSDAPTAMLEGATASSRVLIACWLAAATATVVASSALIASALSASSATPRALAVANPIVVTVVLVAVGLLSPWGRAYLAPAAPNVAHVVMFAAAAMSVRSFDSDATL